MDTINEIILLGKVWLHLAKHHTQLFLLESKLAKMSIVPLCICALLGIIILSCTWIVFTVTIGYVIFHYTQQLLIALLSVLGINLLCLLIIAKQMSGFAENLTFKHTRANLLAYKKMQIDHENETP